MTREAARLAQLEAAVDHLERELERLRKERRLPMRQTHRCPACGGTRLFHIKSVSDMQATQQVPLSLQKQVSAWWGLRKSLGYAGIYSPAAVKLMTGAKAIALCVGLVGGYGLGLLIDNMLLGIPVGLLLNRLLVWLVQEVVNVDIPASFPLWNIALALVGTIVLALLVLALPLRRVVRLRPGEALRYA